MTRLDFTLWLLVLAGLIGFATHAHRQAQQPRQCPPECADCGHSWGPSNKPWCKLKNLKGTK